MPGDNAITEISEAMKVMVINESGEEVEAPLLDVQQILVQHLKLCPILLSDGNAIVLKPIAYKDFQRIQKVHKAWLRENEGAIVEGQRLLEKKDAGETLTEDEQKTLDESAIDTFPYTTELIHAMIDKPLMKLEEFRTLIRDVLPKKDWILIQNTATGILNESYIRITPKN